MSNNRASLLAGLRTGGVRSTTNPLPQSAAPTVSSFNIPQIHTEVPMTAAPGGTFGIPQLQTPAYAQNQLLQMQMMQYEIMRLQALQQATQAKQFQLELARQQQAQQQQQQQQQQHQQRQLNHIRRSTFDVPNSAGPTVQSFPRRVSQAELLKSQLHLNTKMDTYVDQPPMTAALGGKFGARLNPNAASFRFGGSITEEESPKSAHPGTMAPSNTPATATFANTNVISGGTPLGVSGTAATPTNGMTASKSDSSVNWRSGAGRSSPPSTNRSISVHVQEPLVDNSPVAMTKNKPQPLRFSATVRAPLPTVAINVAEDSIEETDDASSSSSLKSDTEISTPRTSSSNASADIPLNPREEASKRLYEGLGLGRPAIHCEDVSAVVPPATPAMLVSRVISQPLRQPRGPPSGADELGPQNFASRIRRKAIGGLGAMLDARINRREIEAF